MAHFTPKPVDAVRIRVPVQVADESQNPPVNYTEPAGTWLVTDALGKQHFMDDATFRSLYDPADASAQAELAVTIP